jgi:hypothetical protein
MSHCHFYSMYYKMYQFTCSLVKMLYPKQISNSNFDTIYKPIKTKYIHSIFNKLPIELIKIIRKYVGITSNDILTIYGSLKTNNIKWTIYEQPTNNIYKIVKIIPHVFKKGAYINTFFKRDPKNAIALTYPIEDRIETEFSDYDLNRYDFEYLYKYINICLNPHRQYVPYPIRGVYISRLDLMISFLLLGYELDSTVHNYNFNCVCVFDLESDRPIQLEKIAELYRSIV